jgi:predicted heme/steroid binding protein
MRRLFPARLYPIVIALLLLLAVPSPKAGATEEYARLTGKQCSACHLDPAGGGELTREGKAFQHSHAVSSAGGVEQPHGRSTPLHLLHFLAGYLHLLVAIFWFGTILYVHVVLKPAYAAHGLPRGEVKVGLLSMAVMAVTGVILTAYRLSSPAALLASRFGILLAIKIGLFLVMAGSALYVVLVIGPRLRKAAGEKVAARLGDLNSDELSKYDGNEGNPAYFAYRGEIFDVSASRLWKNGVHAGRHHAGGDLTEMLGQAPHGEEKLLAMPRVGSLLAAGERRERPLHERVFFFMAYMNLTMVFLIVLIVALWRWW